MRLVVCAAVLMLAGCTGEAPRAPGVHLEDLEQCELHWEDGRAAACTTTADGLQTVAGRPPAPWVCVRSHGFNDASIALYRHAVEDRFAVATSLEGGAVPLGLLHDGRAIEAVWRPDAQGWSHAVLPHGDLLGTQFRIVLTTMESTDARLWDAELSVDVTTRGQEHAPIVHAQGASRYHFSTIGPGYLGAVEFRFFGAIGMDTLFFGGDDFQAQVDMEYSEDIWILAPFNPTCTL